MDKLILRIKNISLKPSETWPTIKEEEATVTTIIMQYLLFLAIVPAVAFYFRNIAEIAAVALLGALLYAVLNVAGIYGSAKLIQLLAGQFGATATEIDTFKLTAYSMTPAMLGTILVLIPWFSGLTFIIALYSLYLLYVGLPVLLTCPDEKRLPFSLLSMVIVYAIFVAVYYIAYAFVAIF